MSMVVVVVVMLAGFQMSWATVVPVKLPARLVVTSVKGLVFGPTPDLFPGTVPAGGLKSTTGNCWPKRGVSAGEAVKVCAEDGSA